MINHRKAFLSAVALLLLAITCASFSQTLESEPQVLMLKPGPQVLTFFSDVDDTEQPYGVYLPYNFDPAKKYPLVIMLHGAGSNHRLALRRVFGKSNLPDENDLEATRYFPEWEDIDYIVASPLARGTMGYQSIPEKDVYDVLADVQERFPIDEDRIYLTGLSMGGGGTLWIGLSRPDIWAAIAPVCPAPPAGTEGLASNALNIPVSIHQGGADPVVRPEIAREWVERLEDAGAQVEYTEYPGVGHNSWENAYEDEAIFDWFGQFTCNRYPDRVCFSTRWYKYSSAYWVEIGKLTPAMLASVDVEFIAPNRIEITTSEVSALTLHLAGHSKFTADRPVDVTIDGETISASITESLSLNQRDGVWIAAKYNVPANAKRPGAEGPMSETIASRHVYVYGTGGDPSPEELQARREQASYATDLSRSTFFGSKPPLISLRTVADNRVRPSDLESSNLVLFGTKETNSIIEKFADHLPIELSAGSSDYGLVYVFPVDGHYIIVNSGLPWWTPPPESNDPAIRRRVMFASGAFGVLMGFKDYILFKGSFDNVTAEGYFDHNWQVPTADAEKMKSTGVVSIKDTRLP